MKTKALIILILLNSFLFNGCTYLRIFTRNLSDAFTVTPRKVSDIVKDPVKNDIKLSALWIGHSSVLLQMYDKVVLIDPFLNKRLGGVFTRRVEAGFNIDYLTKLDAILVSHSHMDHLSFSSLDIIEKKFPNTVLIFPDGAEKYLPYYNFKLKKINNSTVTKKNPVGIVQNLDSIKITPVFSMHTGGRYAFDTYSWKEEGATGYIIQYKDLTVYFPGDTGYDEFAFRTIGNTFKIDLAFIPVGPCRNCDSTGFKYHTSSVEALKMFSDVRAEYMIPIHYGSIRYFSDENYPLKALKKYLYSEDSMYSELADKVLILKQGEQIIIKK